MITATSIFTAEQRRIVEWGDGPDVVIAGAGTGKTRVIVERVRWLLENRERLLPENLLVLTYNVKAARELQDRLDEAVGFATRARMFVSNFHSFCQRILTEHPLTTRRVSLAIRASANHVPRALPVVKVRHRAL